MPVKLKSDFIDYYDHWFDLEGEVFERNSHSGMDRRQMFRYFEKLGLKTPLHGTPQQVFNQLSDSERELQSHAQEHGQSFIDVVIYLDESAHRGEGKLLLPISEAIANYPDHFCSQHIPSKAVGSESYRYLQIGNKVFWLKFSSDDWRSNCGNVSIEVLCQEYDRCHPLIHLPLFAVDFIIVGVDLYTIDFNISPGLKGTGIEKFLTGKEVVTAINEICETSGNRENSRG